MRKLNRRRWYALLAVIAIWLVASAAQESKSKCPTTKMYCPNTVIVGEKLTFTADVRGGDQNVTPTYNWAVSAGAIASGQGTSTITVETKELTGGSSVTATVEVGGFDRECGYGSTVASCTTEVEKKADVR